MSQHMYTITVNWRSEIMSGYFFVQVGENGS